MDGVLRLMTGAVYSFYQFVQPLNERLTDTEWRRMLGIEAVVPAISSFIALALTTFPLVARRKSPWLAFVFTLVVFVGLQNTFHGSTLAVFGPMVALFTIVVECSRVEMAIACVASALGLAAATYGGTSAATATSIAQSRGVISLLCMSTLSISPLCANPARRAIRHTGYPSKFRVGIRRRNEQNHGFVVI